MACKLTSVLRATIQTPVGVFIPARTREGKKKTRRKEKKEKKKERKEESVEKKKEKIPPIHIYIYERP